MTKNRTSLAVGAIALVIGFAAAGCSATHQDAPTPDSDHIVNGTNTWVINMPDGYRNVVFTCWDKTGIYVTSAGSDSSQPSALTVVQNDPHCGGTPQ